MQWKLWNLSTRTGASARGGLRRKFQLHFATGVPQTNAARIGNESVPKIIINNTTNLFFKTAVSILLISNHSSFRVLFDKIDSVYFFEKYIYILALEMASRGNQHCANCIGTLSFAIVTTTQSNVRRRMKKPRNTYY